MIFGEKSIHYLTPLPFASAPSFHQLLCQDLGLLWMLWKENFTANSSGNHGSLPVPGVWSLKIYSSFVLGLCSSLMGPHGKVWVGRNHSTLKWFCFDGLCFFTGSFSPPLSLKPEPFPRINVAWTLEKKEGEYSISERFGHQQCLQVALAVHWSINKHS